MSGLKAGSQFGIYHIVRSIGGGGMAQIYLAKTKGLAGFEKYLALKVINAEYANERRFIQMLIDEAKISVGLSHVNIAQVFDLGQVGGIYYIAMEYVDGLDVLKLVNGLHRLGSRMPVEAAAYVARQVCTGLHYAHVRKDMDGKPMGLVHRDISPQNIIVSRNGDVKIVDFGIAKAAGLSTKTQAGVVKGKVNYMAPEQVLGQQADRRSDVFSVGIVTWEMLTSQMVYSGDNVGELVAKVRKAEISAPSKVRRSIPKELDEIVLTALAAKPKDRFSSAEKFQTALTRFLAKAAPDYGGVNLARLVERVVAQQQSTSLEGGADRLAPDEQVADRHSVIFDLTADGKARLIVLGDRGKQVMQLDESLIVGRAAELTISDVRVSRRHARIFRKDDGYLIEDLGSSNGTFLNSERISGARQLHHRDEIRIGQTRLIFLEPDGGGERAARQRPTIRDVKLVVTYGEHTFTKRLEEDSTDVGYFVRIGPVSMRGRSGRIVRRDGNYFLEPEEGRVPINVNGTPAEGVIKLSVGDCVQVGNVTCTLST